MGIKEDVHATGYDYATFPRKFVSYKWYKPLLVAVLTFVFMFLFQIGTLLLGIVMGGGADVLQGVGDSYDTMNPYTGPGAVLEIGSIAVILPALALSALIVRDRPFSSYTSSRGGWNWGAFAKCVGVALVIQGVLTIVEFALEPGGIPAIDVRFTVAGLVLCMILVPLQCLAEEYVFRGLIFQAVSSWTKLPILGTLISAAVFAWAHPYNLTGVIVIFINGVIWCVLSQKTKGLEASSAAHIVNNMLAFFLGGLSLQVTTSNIDLVSAGVAIAVDVAYVVAVIMLDKKFHWFGSKGDGTVAFNEKRRVALELKEERCARRRGLVEQPSA